MTLLLLLLLGALPTARAQNASQADFPDVPIPTAPVEVDGLVLFELRGVSAFPAEMRAARQVEQIIGAARDPKVDPSKLEIVETENGLELRAGEHSLGLVLEADARSTPRFTGASRTSSTSTASRS